MKVKVFNVGQGDSLLIKPSASDSCIFSTTPLLVDCGPNNQKVYKKIKENEISVLITHSHEDHLGGLGEILNNIVVRSIYIPLYMPELQEISDMLKDWILTGSDPATNWQKIKNVEIIPVGEGDHLCNHAIVFNPPKSPTKIFDNLTDNEISINQALHILGTHGIELNQDGVINYNSPIADKVDIELEYNTRARLFVHNFFKALAQELDESTELIPIETSVKPIATQIFVTRFMNLSINNASIVFKYVHTDGDWLFTGDAGKKVFNRLIKSKTDLTAKYLKVPHHGSKQNLSQKIVSHIKPKIAIISHNNRQFGRSLDPHPNREILNLLNTNSIKIYCTNTVKKSPPNPVKTHVVYATVESGALEFIN